MDMSRHTTFVQAPQNEPVGVDMSSFEGAAGRVNQFDLDAEMQ